MKNNKFKKIISGVLLVAVLATMMPDIAVHAEAGEPQIQEEVAVLDEVFEQPDVSEEAEVITEEVAVEDEANQVVAAGEEATENPDTTATEVETPDTDPETPAHAHTLQLVKVKEDELCVKCENTENNTDCAYAKEKKIATAEITVTDKEYDTAAIAATLKLDKDDTLLKTLGITISGVKYWKVTKDDKDVETTTEVKEVPSEVGKYRAYVTAKLNDTEVVISKKDFEITPKDITGLEVLIDGDPSAVKEYTYMGTEISPAITVKIGNDTLDSKFYNVDNLKKITADDLDDLNENISPDSKDSIETKILITPKNNNIVRNDVPESDATYIVKKGEIKSDLIKISGTTFDYDGKKHGPTVTCSEPGTTVSYSKTMSGNPTEAKATYTSVGTHIVFYTIEKPGYKTVTGEIRMVIEPVSIVEKKATVKLEYTEKTYTGSKFEPKVTVTIGSGKSAVTLKKGTDYKVVYKNNVNAGKATVTVKGIENYKGSIEKTFTIKPKASATLTLKDKTSKVTIASLVGSPKEAVKVSAEDYSKYVIIDSKKNITIKKGSLKDLTTDYVKVFVTVAGKTYPVKITLKLAAPTKETLSLTAKTSGNRRYYVMNYDFYHATKVTVSVSGGTSALNSALKKNIEGLGTKADNIPFDMLTSAIKASSKKLTFKFVLSAGKKNQIKSAAYTVTQ